MAGIRVLEARISHLAYAREIASAMLKRQEATNLVAARSQIVTNALTMVETAMQRLETKATVQLDNATKSSLVRDMMVVLCSDGASNAKPVINVGH